MDNISQAPVKAFISQVPSPRSRLTHEVMEHMFSQMQPSLQSTRTEPSFSLQDGTKFWIRALSPPKKNEGEPELKYSFFVRFEDGASIDHMKFMVSYVGDELDMNTDIKRYIKKVMDHAVTMDDQGIDGDLCFAMFAVTAELKKYMTKSIVSQAPCQPASQPASQPQKYPEDW